MEGAEAEPMDRAMLRRFALLSGLSDPAYEALRTALEGLVLAPGTVLFQQEEPGDALFLVTEGELSVHVRGRAGTLDALPDVRAGEVVGELAFIDPAPRSTTVIARGQVRVYKIDRAGFRSLQHRAPEAASALVGAILREVTRRLRVLDQKIEALLAPTPERLVEHEGALREALVTQVAS